MCKGGNNMKNIVDIAEGMVIDIYNPMLVKGFNGSIVWVKQMGEDGLLGDRMLTLKEIAREIKEYDLAADGVRYRDEWDDIVYTSPVCWTSRFSDEDFERYLDLADYVAAP